MFQSHVSTRLLALSISTLSTATFATASHATDVITLPDTVVTASRIETPLRDVIGDVTVIDAEELKTHAGQTLAEVLQRQASIQLKQDGGLGTVANFYMRGNAAESTLVMIDGVRYGVLSLGGPALTMIPADQVERIEILYGSSATSLYGADAIGGVIQIFTKSGDFSKKNAQVTVGVGTGLTTQANTSLSYGNKNAFASVSAAYSETDGNFSTTKPSNFNYEADDDGYKNESLNIAAGLKLTDNAQINLNGLLARSETDFDSNLPQQNSHSINENGAANISLTADLGMTDLSLSYGYSVDDADSKGQYASIHKTTQEQTKVELVNDIAGGKVLIGAEKLTQRLKSDTAYEKTDRKIDSLLLGYQGSINNFDGQLNIRHDKNSQFGKKTTFSAGLAYELIDGIRLGASHSTGFRAPSFSFLYYPGFSNPSLKPEESENSEVFFEVTTDDVSSRLTLFNNDVENLIGTDAQSQPQNTAKAKLKGVSLKTKWDKGNWFTGFHFDYLDAKNTVTKKELVYRAKHSGGLFAGMKVADKLTVRGEYAYVGKRFIDNSNTQTLDRYVLINASAGLKLSPHVDLNLRWNNVFGEDYEMSKGYNTLGANMLASITIHNK